MTLDAGIDLLACPHCGAELGLDGVVSCASGHSFDVARQGYLNLSDGPQPKNADTAEMVAARVTFLAAGHYARLADTIVTLVPEQTRSVLDAGGGTGGYAARVLSGRPGSRGVVLDVSVPAIRRAARAHPRVAAVVADVWRPLPIRAAVVDVVLSVFAPRNGPEFARVLTETGRVITVTPESAHLAELRRDLDLLGHHPDKSEQVARSLAGHFRAEHSLTLLEHQTWQSETARQSVLMGPNAFHLSPMALDQRLARLRWPRSVTVSVRLDVFVRAQEERTYCR